MIDIRKTVNNNNIIQPKKSNQLKDLNQNKYGLIRNEYNSKFIKKTNKFFDNIEKHVATTIGKK